jgi:uncharacterized protein (DUF2062 family)
MKVPGSTAAASSAGRSAGRSRAGALVDKLLKLHDTPSRTAAAFAIGVFFSFSPFIGLQILLSMGLAFAFGLNRLAVFVGLNANLPWIMVPWYAGTTVLAASLLGRTPESMRQQVEALFAAGWAPLTFLERAADLLSTAFVPLMIGATAGAAVVALAAYALLRAVLVKRAARPGFPAALP